MPEKHTNRFRLAGSIARVVGLFSIICVQNGFANTPCRGMTVPDMINLAKFSHFETVDGNKESVLSSPDNRYVISLTRRGDIEKNSIIDKLMVWDTQDIYKWLRHGGERPMPISDIERQSTNKFSANQRNVIREVMWSKNSNSILFLGESSEGRGTGLYESSVSGRVKLLSNKNQNVRYYSSKGAQVIYESAAMTRRQYIKVGEAEDKRRYFFASDRSLFNLLFPGTWPGIASDKLQFWVVKNGVRRRIPVRSSQWRLRDMFRHVLEMSGDHKNVILDLPVRYVPSQWTRYGRTRFPVWSHVGSVPAGAGDIWVPHQYVVLNLSSGRLRAAVQAPDGGSRGFWASRPGEPRPGGGVVSWAPDGRAALLWNTFVPIDRSVSQEVETVHGLGWGVKVPCVAIVDLKKPRVMCVEWLSRHVAGGRLVRVAWQKGRRDHLLLSWKLGHRIVKIRYCVYAGVARWIRWCGLTQGEHASKLASPIHLRVVQSLNEPPRLIAFASRSGIRRVLYDPNSKLRRRCIGTARTILLNIGENDRRKAGLLLPVNYIPGRRYPMVIQTHGYQSSQFMSTGFSVPFAARAFAAVGMSVMQLPMCRGGGSQLDDIRCDVSVIRAAVRYAVSHRIADPNKIGIIGFSATGADVLAALESNRMRFAAAEVVDAYLGTYSEFIESVGILHGYADAFETPKAGGPPFGEGLKWWIARSPGFSIYKIKSPVLIQANGRQGVLGMWEPYAILHYLRKPVSLVVMQKGTHPFSEPARQLASTKLGVNWFGFWLENKRPTNSAEYQHWSGLRRSAEIH